MSANQLRSLIAKYPILEGKFNLISVINEEDILPYLKYDPPDQGVRRTNTIEEITNQLLSPEVAQGLNKSEIFILLCAIQLHEIGRITETGDGKFLEKTKEILLNQYSNWSLDKYEADLIWQVCSGIDGDKFLLLENTGSLHLDVIRLKFLSALLRMSRTLDTDYTKVRSNTLQKQEEISPESVEQWKRMILGISSVTVDSSRWEIQVTIVPQLLEDETRLRQFIKQNLEEELKFVSDIFTSNGLFYKNIFVVIESLIAHRNENTFMVMHKVYLDQQTKDTYKFIKPFSTFESKLFFGRASDITRLLTYITSKKLVVLFGESGVGKSSLINAGIIPNLINKGYIPICVKFSKDGPTFDVRAETRKILSMIDSGVGENLQDSMAGYFKSLSQKGYELVIIIDQFEELFLRFPKEICDTFMKELIECLHVKNSIKVRFVLGIRQDHFGEIASYGETIKELVNNAYFLSKLRPEDIKEAIIQPAKLEGISFEEELLNKLVDEIYCDDKYNTPHIEIICNRLFGALKGKKLVTLDLYEKIGPCKRILTEFLDQVIEKDFKEEQRENVKEILKSFVTSQGTKKSSSLVDIAQHIGMEPKKVLPLLNILVDESRIVTILNVHDQIVYDLSHEFLIGKINEWISQSDLEVKEIDENINRAALEWKKRGYLLNSDRLAKISFYRAKLKFDVDERQLIFSSYLKAEPNSEEKWFWFEGIEKDAPDLVQEILLKDTQLKGKELTNTYLASIEILASIGKRKGIFLLLKRLGDPDWKVRQVFVEALSQCQLKEKDLLMLNEQNSNWRIRMSVSKILKRKKLETLLL